MRSRRRSTARGGRACAEPATAKAVLRFSLFLPVAGRYLRWTAETGDAERALDVIDINVYGAEGAASVLEKEEAGALGHCPVNVPAGGSITVDFRSVRYPLRVFIEWGKTYGTVFSVHLSDDGESFREVGRITTGNGDSNSFWWRSTTSRFFRLTVQDASSPDGAVVSELKLRLLNKDRMPIGQLERAALQGRGELYPQSLLGRQVYWTALGSFDQDEEALFDEYGNIEPQRGSGQIMPFIRIDGVLHGAPGSPSVRQSLVDGSLPVPDVVWLAADVELQIAALIHDGQAKAEYHIANLGGATRKGALVLTLRPVRINPYWQHGGHAITNAIAVAGKEASVNDRPFVAFSRPTP